VSGTDFKIAKIDEPERLVFGWANVTIQSDGSPVVDSQRDIILTEDLEAAAYDFVLEFRDTGVMHKGKAVGTLVESFVMTPEKIRLMGLAPDGQRVGWWVGFKVDLDVFKRVLAGELQMFSIQGTADRVEPVYA